MSDTMPEEIYLVGGEWHPEDTTWSEVRINEDDTHYTRTDLIPAWNEDMDAAPRDGTEILAVNDEGIIQVIRWSKHNHVPIYGWIRQIELYGEEVDGFDPVAWLPLPKPPQTGGE